jgi:hypothetical protein
MPNTIRNAATTPDHSILNRLEQFAPKPLFDLESTDADSYISCQGIYKRPLAHGWFNRRLKATISWFLCQHSYLYSIFLSVLNWDAPFPASLHFPVNTYYFITPNTLNFSTSHYCQSTSYETSSTERLSISPLLLINLFLRLVFSHLELSHRQEVVDLIVPHIGFRLTWT